MASMPLLTSGNIGLRSTLMANDIAVITANVQNEVKIQIKKHANDKNYQRELDEMEKFIIRLLHGCGMVIISSPVNGKLKSLRKMNVFLK